ncbi:MAG: hypothetical protein KIT09_36145 [Bryobacteraceae bacterium]|nr:hypothetical protein [Bryobacteraceae bacterium]
MKYKLTLDFGTEEPKEPLELPDPTTITYSERHPQITPEKARSFWEAYKDDPKFSHTIHELAAGKINLGDVWFAWRDDPRIVERGFDELDVFRIAIWGNPDLFKLEQRNSR